MINTKLSLQSGIFAFTIVALSACTVNRPVNTSAPSAGNNGSITIEQPEGVELPSRAPRQDILDMQNIEIKYEPLSAKGNTPYEVNGIDYMPLLDAKGYVENGQASWYGEQFHGLKTSNGEVFDMYELTAAHKTLPLPSYARVTNLQNNKSVVVRINDRGPFIGERSIDLSYAAAQKIGMANKGLGNVMIEVISPEVDENTIYDAAYYIQAGAFSDINNAEKLKSVIDTRGFNATVKKHEGLYKVKVGPYENPQIAYREAQNLSKQVQGYSYHVTD